VRTITVACLALALTLSSNLKAEIHFPACPARFDRILSNAAFRDHRVLASATIARPIAPLVSTGPAHSYRTAIREGAKRGPNFAGHYTIVEIGCGSAAVCTAIADARTGRVYFPAAIREVGALLVDTGNVDVGMLNYRRNSRLMIVIGTPNDDRTRAGVGYYIWNGGHLRLIRHISAPALCGLPPQARF
jgi:hypothetical protein